MENEIWKEYPANSDYSVSSLGRVYSNPRLSKAGHKRKGIYLKPTLDAGYLKVKIGGKNRTVHQLVAETFLGHKPCGYKLVVNHINFDGTDNRLSNLEIVTQRENANQKHLKSSSKYIGVSWSKEKSKWHAQIKIDGSTKYLGRFKCELAAAHAYQVALKQLHVNGI